LECSLYLTLVFVTDEAAGKNSTERDWNQGPPAQGPVRYPLSYLFTPYQGSPVQGPVRYPLSYLFTQLVGFDGEIRSAQVVETIDYLQLSLHQYNLLPQFGELNSSTQLSITGLPLHSSNLSNQCIFPATERLPVGSGQTAQRM